MITPSNKSALHLFAKTITWITSPYVVSVVIIASVTMHGTRGDISRSVLYIAITVLIMILLPLIYVIFSMRSGRVTDVHIRIREQRYHYYAIGGAFAILSILTLFLLKAPKELIALLVSVLVGAGIGAFMNRRAKVSAHGGTLGAAVGIVFLFFGPVASLAATVVLVISGWSRVALGEHTPKEIAAGAIVGCVATTAVFLAFGFRPT